MPGSVELARAYVQVIPSMQGVQSSINTTFGKAGDTAGRTVGDRTRGGILKGVAAAGAGIIGAIGVVKAGQKIGDGLGAVISKGLTRAVDIQNAQKKLLGLGHSANDVTKIMGNALSSVKGTAFGLGDAATVAANAVAAGIKPGKDLTAYLKTTADTATIAGASLGDIGSILNKATANTTVYSDTLGQLSDRGIPVFSLLAKHYGITQGALSTMVRKGQVDSKTLVSVLQKNLAGSALKSGETAEGAYANVGAAFGRLGVQLGAGTAVGKAPALFTAIATAVDSGATAIKPLSDILNTQLAAGFDSLTSYVNHIDFAKVGAHISVVAANVKLFLAGLTGKGLPPAVFPVSGFVTAGTKVRGILTSTIGVVHGFISGVQTAFAGLSGGKGLNLSGFGQVGKTLSDIHTIASPLFPALLQVAKAAGGLGKAFGGLIAAGIPILPPILKVLTGIVGFLADHIHDILPLLPLIAVGFVAWRSATTATAAANRLLTAAQLAALPVTLTNTSLRLLAARAELQVAAANGLTTSSIVANGVATVRQTVATVAAGVAQKAAAVGTGIATAAQWLFNAALDANPIGIVVLAIAALVAGLVFFFTQTKVGQDAWAAFTGFIVSAFQAVVGFFQTAIAAIGGFFAKFGPQILLIIAPFIGIPLLIISHWGEIVGFFQGLIGKILGFLGGLATAAVAGGGKLISGLLAGALAGLLALGRWEASILAAIVGALAGAGKWLLNTGESLLRGLLAGSVAAFVAIGRFGQQVRSTVTGALAAAGSWLLATGQSLLKGLVQGGVNAFFAIGRFGQQVQSTVTGALNGAKTWLLTIGGQIIDGLVSGIRGGIGAAVSAVSGLINLLPAAVRNLLGIHSPSKVFATIGRYVAQGLVQGLSGSHDSVVTASTKLANGVTDAFSKLVAQRTSAQKKLDSLDKRLSNTNTSTKGGRSAAANLRSQIADQAKLVRTLKAQTKGINISAISKALKTDNAKIASLATRRDALADQLKTAQGNLADAVKVKTDFGASVQQTSIGLGNVIDSFNAVLDARSKAADAVTDLTGKLSDLASSQSTAQADVAGTQQQLNDVTKQIQVLSAYGTDYASKISDLTTQRNDLASTLADQMSKVADYATQTSTAQADLAAAQASAVQSSTPKLVSTLQAAIANTNTFQAVLAQLKSQGLDDTTYSQLVSAGVSGGGLQAAQELAAAGTGVVQQVAGLQNQLAAAGQALGTATSTVLYQQGVDIAQAAVDGIQAKIVDNQAAIALWEAAIAVQLQKLGLNTKPLTRTAGEQIVAGLTDGISGKQSDLDKAIDTLGKSAVKRLKKVLGIKSPSRVVREQVGQQVGAGFVLGIEDMHSAAEDAAASLASVPSAAFGFGDGDLFGTAPAPIQQVFTGPMGYTRDEVAEGIATKARRAIAGVNIPKVRVG